MFPNSIKFYWNFYLKRLSLVNFHFLKLTTEIHESLFNLSKFVVSDCLVCCGTFLLLFWRLKIKEAFWFWARTVHGKLLQSTLRNYQVIDGKVFSLDNEKSVSYFRAFLTSVSCPILLSIFCFGSGKTSVDFLPIISKFELSICQVF